MKNHSPVLTSPLAAEKPCNGDFLVKAVPVKVVEAEAPHRPDSLSLDTKPSNVIEISSDSDLSIERVYNPLTGQITEKFPTDVNHNDVKTNDSKRQLLSVLTAPEEERVKSPADLTYEEFVGSDDVEKNLVPSKIQQYEQINGSTKRLSQSSPNLVFTPKPKPRNFHVQRTHDEPKVILRFNYKTKSQFWMFY